MLNKLHFPPCLINLIEAGEETDYNLMHGKQLNISQNE